MIKFKDSGVEWIGQVPEHWEVKRIRHLVQERNEKNENLQTTTMLSLSAKKGVTLYDEEENHSGNRPREDLSGYKVVQPGDIVVNSMNILSGSVGLSKYNGCVSPVYYMYETRKGYSRPFVYRIFQSKQFQLSLRGLGNGILIKESENGTLNTIRTRIPSKKLLNEYFPVPPRDEQERIAEYLEEKCSTIDKLINLQENELDKLKDYKQSIISESITKNYRGQKVVDSGFSWIGQVPEDYIISRLKFALKEQMMYGANESGERLVNTEDCYRYIRITDITSDNKLKDNEENLYLTKEKAQGFILNKKDILFARSGGTVGKTFMYEGEDNKSAFAGYLIKARCDETKLLPEFLMYFTQSSIYERWKNMIFIQATIQNIGANKYSNMELVLPPIDEQRKIVNLLDSKTKTIIDLIEKKEEKIQKLKDFKQSLIYECVTGKKEI